MTRLSFQSGAPFNGARRGFLLLFSLLTSSSRSYVVVTGRGLGLDIVRELCSGGERGAEGALPVVLGTRDPAAARREVEARARRGSGESSSSGSWWWPDMLAVEELDVSSAASVDAFAAATLRRHGGAPPAALVNSAAACPGHAATGTAAAAAAAVAEGGGGGGGGSAEELDAAKALRLALATNVHGPLRLMERLHFVHGGAALETTSTGDSRSSGGGSADVSPFSGAAGDTSSSSPSSGRCVVNISSGDGETQWLHSALARAFAACSEPGQVLGVLHDDAGTAQRGDSPASSSFSPLHHSKTTTTTATEASPATGGSAHGGLVWRLLEERQELAFGPTPAYAVSKAAVNALTRTLAASSALATTPSFEPHQHEQDLLPCGSRADASADSASSASAAANTIDDSSIKSSSKSKNSSSIKSSNKSKGGTGNGSFRLAAGVAINAVCPGDVVGSALYSGGGGGGEWDVSPERAAADVAALLRIGILPPPLVKAGMGSSGGGGDHSNDDEQGRCAMPSPTGGFFRFRRRVPM
jgi:NAD(P)-dependent dehydrogenase (short-subunit alcohol dehydrogenase family)